MITWGAVTTHPNPSTVEERPDFVGGATMLADGSLSVDQMAQKTRITVAWEGLTSTQMNALYALAVAYSAAAMDLSNAGGANYGNVVPIPNSARMSAVPSYPVTYMLSVEVRTQ